MYNKSEAKFSICFGGEKEIDLNTLIKSLEPTGKLITYIFNKENKDGYIKINVKGTQEGCFQINLCALIGVIPTLLTIENINLAKTYIDILTGLLNIKKHLKGKKAKGIKKKLDSVIIENHNCKNMNVNYNVFKLYNKESDKVMGQIFKNCNRDSFSIKDEVGNYKFIARKDEDFDNMSKTIYIDEEKQQKEKKIVTNVVKLDLKVKKPDFTGNSQWDLVILKKEGKIIKATIEDIDFINKVHLGNISINAKTIITAEVIIQSYLDEMNDKIKDNFIIKRVIEINSDNFEQISYFDK